METPQKLADLENNVNQGVIAPTPDEVLAAGELDMSQFPIISPDGNNDKYLSDFDPQFINGFDTLACNIFAGVGMSEVYLNALGENKIELSDRYPAVESGLNGSMGSSEAQWENGVNNYGLVNQADWPTTPDLTKQQYFEAVPDAVIELGRGFLSKYTPFHRPVGTDLNSLREALKYGAVKIFVGTGPGWNQAEPNVVPVNNGTMNHAVMVRYIDDLGIHIRDQYAPFLKVLDPNYKIFYAFQTLYKKAPTFHHAFNRDLQYGQTDFECIALQTALMLDGEFPNNVAYSMHFGDTTLHAVQAFQVKYGIVKPGEPGYGRCGPKTRQQLNLLFGS